MLAKEFKIKNLKKQREFIEEQLSREATREDGDTSYRYVGHIFPEVIEYFEGEGFNVTKLNSDMLATITKGYPVYLFTVSDGIKLTAEEMAEAEAYELPKDPEDDVVKQVEDFFGISIRGW